MRSLPRPHCDSVLRTITGTYKAGLPQGQVFGKPPKLSVTILNKNLNMKKKNNGQGAYWPEKWKRDGR